MNDDLLASAVSDWLQASDAPPAAPAKSRASAVGRARETRQARIRLPRRYWGRDQAVLPLAAAAVVVLALAVALMAGFSAINMRPEHDLQPAYADEPSPDEPVPEPETRPTGPKYGGDPVTLDLDGATLSGRRWPDGTVRVLQDGAGNETDLIDDLALAPDGKVWIARNNAIFALGQEGKHRPPVEEGERRWRIIGLEAQPDGSLEVLTYRALWHFDDGAWTELPTPPEIEHESDLDGYFPDPMEDGSIWGSPNDERPVFARYTDSGWVDYRLTEVMPKSFPRQPAQTIRIDLDGARDGTIWLAPMDGPVALAYFDGTAWTEYSQAFIKGVLGHRPARISDILAAPDGTTWFLFGADGDPRDLLRVKDGEWTSTSIRAIRRKAGAPGDIPFQWLAEAAEDGAVQMYAGEDEHREALWWDGDDARLLDFGVFTPEGETADGTLWGVGRNRDVGLLVRPAAD